MLVWVTVANLYGWLGLAAMSAGRPLSEPPPVLLTHVTCSVALKSFSTFHVTVYVPFVWHATVPDTIVAWAEATPAPIAPTTMVDAAVIAPMATALNLR